MSLSPADRPTFQPGSFGVNPFSLFIPRKNPKEIKKQVFWPKPANKNIRSKILKIPKFNLFNLHSV